MGCQKILYDVGGYLKILPFKKISFACIVFYQPSSGLQMLLFLHKFSNICKPEVGWYGQPKYCYG